MEDDDDVLGYYNYGESIYLYNILIINEEDFMEIVKKY